MWDFGFRIDEGNVIAINSLDYESRRGGAMSFQLALKVPQLATRTA